jgi:hypothetical protein
MAVMQIFFKTLLVLLTVPIFLYIPVPEYFCSSLVIENNIDAFN